VGIDALSSGASFVRFVDLNRPAVITIRANLEKTGLSENAEVIQSDAFTFLNRRPDRTFDIIYIAPPQYKDMWVQAMHSLDANSGWLQADTWVIVQIDPIEYQELSLSNLVEFEQRKYGNTLLVFYERPR
jgi:16S rRNA G966 N2-methylase RsmD